MITALLTTLIAQQGVGGIIFIEDFDGDKLKPYWYISQNHNEPPYNGKMEYKVEDGLFKVLKVWGPMNDGNITRLYTNVFERKLPYHLRDFDISVLFGWEKGQYHGIHMIINDLYPIVYAGYSNSPFYGEPSLVSIFYFWGGGILIIPGPDSGFHELRAIRRGKNITLLFDGVYFDQHDFPYDFIEVRSLSFHFI